MAMQYAHGSFTWGSGDSVGTTYTCSPGFQAQLIRVWCMGLDSGTDAASQTVHLVRSMGYATSASNRFCVGTFSEDAQTAADCSTALMDNCVLVTTAGTTVITGQLDLDSISATTFDFINDNAPDQNITVFWEAWNDDVSGFTMWAAGFSAPGATGDQAFTGLTGIEAGNPDGDQLLVCFSKQATAAVNSGAANDSGLGIGWATGAGGSGSSEQVVCWGNSDDASGTMDTDGACHSGLIIAMCIAGGAATENNRAYLKQWDTDGFTLTWDAASTNRMGYVVIKGGRWQAGELTLNTTAVSNTATVSGLSFQPVGIEVMGRRSAEQSHNVAVAQDVLSWGCASSTSSRRAMGCWGENATADSEINLCIEYDGVLAYPTNAGAIDAVYDVSAFASDGFTIIVDDAPGTGNASEWIGWLAFGAASASTTHAGTGTPSLPLLTASGTGTKIRKGTGAANIPLLTASGTAKRGLKSTGSANLPLLTAAGSGTKTRKGTGAVSLPLTTASGSGTKARKGTGAADLPLPTASGTGDSFAPGVTWSGSGAATLPLLTASGSGTKARKGTGAADLPLIAASGTAKRGLKATGAADLPLLTASGAGTKTRKGTGSADLPLPTASGAGKKARAGSGSGTLPLLTASGVGKQAHAGTGASTLPILTASGVAKRGLKGTGTADLPLLTADGAYIEPPATSSSRRLWRQTFSQNLK